MRILLFFWVLLSPILVKPSVLQEQIATMKRRCGHDSELLVKKILISVLKDESFKLGIGCSDGLSFLINQCSSGLDCQGLINLYQNKLDNKKSGSIIGE